MSRLRVLMTLAVMSMAVPPAEAQVLGTFRWNTAPYCNVIVVTVTTAPGGVYTLDGYDEQCGGNPRQPVRGMAVPQANGTVTLGLSVITAPGSPDTVAILGSINLADLGGGWSDNAGNSGTLVFNPAAVAGGPRTGPVPPTPVPSSIVFSPNGNLAAIRGPGNDAIPAVGGGTRMMFWSARGAFRTGTVSGGQWDAASIGLYSTAMGFDPTAYGAYSTAIGFQVSAMATAAVAIGSRAVSGHQGSVVIGDLSPASALALSSADNQFSARFANGFRLFTNATQNQGLYLAANGAQWLGVSDRNAKRLFRELDGDEVLAKIASMPIPEWSYKEQDASIRHVGPMAQDFTAAFGLGEEPLKIGSMDIAGITLRAVQAVESRERAATAALEARIAELERRLEELAASTGAGHQGRTTRK